MEQNQQSQPPVFNPQEPTQQPDPQYQPRVNARPMLEPVQAVQICLKKFFDFTGRARRSEYWWFVLFVMIVSMVFNFIGAVFPMVNILGLIVGLLLSIAQLAALTRRLHDTGRSGWWVLVYGLFMLVTYGALVAILAPVAGELMAEGDQMALVELMANAFMDSPIAATVMICGALATAFMAIITLIFAVKDSQWTENKYGPSPKYQ